MEILGIGPGPLVGEAHPHLLELRTEHRPLGACPPRRRELLSWHQARPGFCFRSQPIGLARRL